MAGGSEPLLEKNKSCTMWAGFEERLDFVGGTMALVVGMVGTGAVAFPYGFALCGYIAGPLVLLLVGALSYGSYVSLINCAAKQQVAAYGGLVKQLSPSWERFGKFALWTILILCTSAYVLISADIVRSIALPDEVPGDERPILLTDPVLFALILLLVLPMCLLKSMRGLATISTYCCCALAAVICLIVAEALQICSARRSSPVIDADRYEMTPVRTPSSMLLAAPIFGTAMFGHMNMAQIYAELQPHLKPKASSVALTATVITLAIYTTIGFSGYVAFGRSASPDVMKQIASEVGESTPVMIGQALLASFIILKTPLLILPVRQVTYDTFAPDGDAAALSTGRHVALTVGLLFCVYIFAVAIPDLGKLLEVVGAMSAVPIIFIVPARLSWSLEAPRPTLRCIVLGVFGVVVSVVSLTLVASGS